jgi:hypothetical protein
MDLRDYLSGIDVNWFWWGRPDLVKLADYRLGWLR